MSSFKPKSSYCLLLTTLKISHCINYWSNSLKKFCSTAFSQIYFSFLLIVIEIKIQCVPVFGDLSTPITTSDHTYFNDPPCPWNRTLNTIQLCTQIISPRLNFSSSCPKLWQKNPKTKTLISRHLSLSTTPSVLVHSTNKKPRSMKHLLEISGLDKQTTPRQSF